MSCHYCGCDRIEHKALEIAHGLAVEWADTLAMQISLIDPTDTLPDAWAHARNGTTPEVTS